MKPVLRKLLIAIVLVLSIATLGLIILLFMEQKIQKDPVCRSAACRVIGSAIRQSLDLRVDPCQDFYAYCCGGWLKTHEVPPDMKKFGITEKLENEVLLKINGLLTSSNSSGIAWRNAVKFYNSCMNMTAIEKRGAAPLLTYFTRFGGWPLLNKQWQEKDFDWITALTVVQLTTGYGYVIPIIIGTDPKNTSRKLLQLDQPNLLFPEEILRQPNSESSKSHLQKFQKFLNKIAVLLGADISTISEYVNSLLEFEIQLFEMMSPEENMNNISYWYNTMTVGDLQRKIPEVNWVRFLQELTNSSLLLVDGEPTIQNEDIIIVRDLPYIQKISKYLRNASHIRHIANYLGCRVAMSLMLHLPKNFSDALYEYYGDLGYTFRSPERWKTCTKRVSSFFNQVTVFAYVDKYFPKDVKNEVNKLVLDISFQFEKILLSNDWMDRITKNAALKKLRAMKANIGYPDWIGDENNINDVYVKENMPTMDDKVFENDVKLVEHRVMQLIKTLRLKLEEA
ncbi:Membrane metallo-endopeptidase-like 1, partial [Stegodyphus mimosarum]